MRKWFTWCLLTAVAFVGSGCSDDDDGGQVKLAFSKRTAVFGAGGGAVSINVDAAGAWSAAQPEAGWLEVEYDATSMRLHAEANPSPEVRQAEVVVTTGDYTATIDVAQEPAEPVTSIRKGAKSCFRSRPTLRGRLPSIRRGACSRPTRREDWRL